MFFADRSEAGRKLAAMVADLDVTRPVVIGLPRGGVVVAAEIARTLKAPLDVLIVRKLGVPYQPELGAGAIAEDGTMWVNDELLMRIGLDRRDLAPVIAAEKEELERRVARYRGARKPVDVHDRTVILVDDGLATGGTALAAAMALRSLGARRVLLAVPVAAPDSVERLRPHVEAVICPAMPISFGAIGQFYADFSQTSDREVTDLLEASQRWVDDGPTVEELVLDLGGVTAAGLLALPTEPRGLVIFAHGSGSSRLSPRNARVADRLNGAGYATLLFDLLTDAEAVDRANVFDIELLAHRLAAATDWATHRTDLHGLPHGYFGASTGAAAALRAAADHPGVVQAVVSRGGRPDLVGDRLPQVAAATLLIVGALDEHVIDLNHQAADRMLCPHEVVIVPDAGHLFEEPGALETVAALAADWFGRHLSPPA